MAKRFALTVSVACLLAMQAAALDISNRFSSPRNPERQVRSSTKLIVLHTTEAPARSSLNKVSERGECHFCVTEEGTVYAIVDRDRVAFHAGRSMWQGKEDVDKFSIGIECVGYHDKPMGQAQLKAIAALVKDLKKMYKIPDHCVVAHSHVAYGAPNKWQKRNHRGRKRCGMLFATATVRKILDLKSKPGSDVDVQAGRLDVGDEFLAKVLYKNEDVMAKNYSSKPVPVIKALMATKKEEKQWTPSPNKAANKIGLNKKDPIPQSVEDLKKRGYVVKGVIQPGMTAAKIAGSEWRSETTFYSVKNRIFSGKTVDPKSMPKGMYVWMKDPKKFVKGKKK